ncbi:MAG: hypothetical protein RL199_18 [Pseudomonadota bacterium]|jgi:hypothetical protein
MSARIWFLRRRAKRQHRIGHGDLTVGHRSWKVNQERISRTCDGRYNPRYALRGVRVWLAS